LVIGYVLAVLVKYNSLILKKLTHLLYNILCLKSMQIKSCTFEIHVKIKFYLL
jgi:hypothetical protein